MSIDVSVLIVKSEKKIDLFEVNDSTDHKKLLKSFTDPQELLAYLEENNIGYEGFTVKGFTKIS